MASGDRQNTKPARKGDGSGSKLSQKEQSERFKEAARELGVDESGIQFERVIDAILPKNQLR